MAGLPCLDSSLPIGLLGMVRGGMDGLNERFHDQSVHADRAGHIGYMTWGVVETCRVAI